MNSMEMIVGFIAGSVVASGVWGILWALLKSERRAYKSSLAIMQDLATECAEIENFIVSKGINKITKTDFQSSVSSRLDKITKKLSSHMDFFDVYYVKYIESLIARYRQELLASEKSDQSVKEAKSMESVEASIKKEEEEILLSTKAEETIKPPVEPVSDEDFDKTWQMDFSIPRSESILHGKNADAVAQKEIKKTPVPDSEDKFEVQLSPEETKTPVEPPSREKVEETTLDRRAPDEGKDTKIIKTEDIPKDKQSEIEKIIIAELSHEQATKGKESRAEETKKAEETVQDFSEATHAETTTQKEKATKKKEKAPSQRNENFISGEDLVAKLDSFFGIKE